MQTVLEITHRSKYLLCYSYPASVQAGNLAVRAFISELYHLSLLLLPFLKNSSLRLIPLQVYQHVLSASKHRIYEFSTSNCLQPERYQHPEVIVC